MNEWQLIKEIKSTLLARVWGTSSNKVFPSGGVVISPDTNKDRILSNLRVPMAVIIPGGGSIDPAHTEEPDLVTVSIGVELVTMQAGDGLGENALMGANYSDDTLSEGKGIFQLEEELFNAIEFLNAKDAVRIQFVAKSEVAAVTDDRNNTIAFRDYTFEAEVTKDRSFDGVFGLSAVVS